MVSRNASFYRQQTQGKEKQIEGNSSVYIVNIEYRKIPNVSPGLLEVFKHFLGAAYIRGAYIRRGLYSEGILC